MAASDWQRASAPVRPPRSPPLPEPALVMKMRMLSGAFGAFCARAAENPSDRSAIEATRDSVFIGDFIDPTSPARRELRCTAASRCHAFGAPRYSSLDA